MSNAEPSARAKFGKAVKYQQELAEKNPELFAKANEIMKRISSGDILWMTGLMEALQEGKKMAQQEPPSMAALPSMAPPVPAILRRRARS